MLIVGDKDMISLLLRSGAKDENSELLGTCLLENNTDIVRFMLKHHAHIDTQHKILVQGNTAGNFHMILRRGPSISVRPLPDLIIVHVDYDSLLKLQFNMIAISLLKFLVCLICVGVPW